MHRENLNCSLLIRDLEMLSNSSSQLRPCSRVSPRLTKLMIDELRLVQTSLLGSVLSNLLLVLGMSFFA